MLCIPKLAHMIYEHLALNEEELRPLIPYHWFWLLLGIYAAMTNQVSIFSPILKLMRILDSQVVSYILQIISMGIEASKSAYNFTKTTP